MKLNRYLNYYANSKYVLDKSNYFVYITTYFQIISKSDNVEEDKLFEISNSVIDEQKMIVDLLVKAYFFILRSES